MARASSGKMTSRALSQGISASSCSENRRSPSPPPHPRRRQRPSSSGVDWLLEAKPETPETAMLNGIRCTDSRPPSREAAPTSRTAHSTRVPSYLPRRERPTDRHLLRAHAHVAQAGRGKRNLSPPSAPTPSIPSPTFAASHQPAKGLGMGVTLGDNWDPSQLSPPPRRLTIRAGVERARRLCADRSAAVIPMHSSRRHEPRRAQARASNKPPPRPN